MSSVIYVFIVNTWLFTYKICVHGTRFYQNIFNDGQH